MGRALCNPPANLAWCLAESGGDPAEARRWLKVAQTADPGAPQLADTEAWIAYREGDFAGAWKAFQPALSLVRSIPEVAYHAGAIQARLGRRPEAIEALRAALQSRAEFSGSADARELLRRLQAETP